MPKTNCIYLG